MMKYLHNMVLSVRERAGFTLIETLVAISLLAIAIVAPMSLTTQSLSAAYYARDQVTAFFLAQDAIEGVRSVRDGNILRASQGIPTDLMANIKCTASQPMVVDTHTNPVSIMACASGSADVNTACTNGATCPVLQTQTGGDSLYGYGTNGWTATNFTRTVTACYVQPGGACNGTVSDEIRISATVTWQTAAYEVRTFTLSENLYRWLDVP